MSTDIEVIDVDDKGVDANGEDFGYTPEPRAVAAGYVLAQRVVLRYPDGRLITATRTMVTQKGMEELGRRMNHSRRTRH